MRTGDHTSLTRGGGATGVENVPIRMLVVDDSEDDAFLLYSELARRGTRVEYRRVDNAVDMETVLAHEDWQIIICDHSMPGFDSFGALDILKKSCKDVPFIIYSGHISDQLAVSAMNDGVSDFIQKGNFARLIPVIERELRGAEARQAVRQADHRIKELAFYDSLSSLPNQNLFCARVTEWIVETGRHGKELRGALFCIDVDRFLRINSSFGYETGNGILRQMARRLQEIVAPHAMLARLGGDEFGIFCPGLNQPEALNTFANWLLKTFDEPFLKDKLELYLTPSIGIALLTEDGDEVYELLMNAETAVSHVKRSGGNAYKRYSREMNAASAERVALEGELRHAVERNELYLQYQPCLNARTGRTVGVEALVRWRHPTRGVIPPDRFIPIADESGLITGIGAWVLGEACRQGEALHRAGFVNLSMAVNVSAVQFGQPRLLEVVSQTLEETGFPARHLQLEITESVLMQDAESANGMLRAFRNMGVKLSVDDFGTGYSSLSYLKRFPIDILKIDKSFVRDVTVNEDDSAIARAIIAIAKSLRLTTIAEGVETRSQAEFLRGEGCDSFQGYFFSRPLDPDKLLARLVEEEKNKVLQLH